MPNYTMPAIDQSVVASWNEQDVNLYNRLPYYLAKQQVDSRKTWATWSKFCGKRRWIPNSGDLMKGIRKEPSPHIRQMLFPNAIASLPKKDVIDVREIQTSAQVYRHRFESQVMNFVPSFRDFLNDHVDFHMKDIMEKQTRAEDIYIRGNIWYNSPYVWLPDRTDGELISAPTTLGNAAGTLAGSKTSAWVVENIKQIGNQGNLSLMTVNRLLTTMDVDLRALPFSGSGSQPADNKGMMDKYVLVCSSEAYNQFALDPFLLSHKNAQLDIIQEGFRGNLFGRVTCRLEDMPLRFAADGSIPAPETREGNPAAWDYNTTVVNPDYRNAAYEVAWLVGAEAYEVIEVGPPPAAFASNGMPKGFGKMFWNGEVQIAKNFLIEMMDDEGNIKYDTNQYGEYLKLISQVTYGILPVLRRNIVPILFKRKRGASAPIISTAQGQF